MQSKPSALTTEGFLFFEQKINKGQKFMCGFMVFRNKIQPLETFKKEFQKLVHRGPDDTEFHQIDGETVFGFHRLSIIDISKNGNQPFLDANSGNILMCNGEIFNHIQLEKEFTEGESPYPFGSKSDCEVILPLYKKYGLKGTAQKLDAEFAFVIYDKSKKVVIAGRDPIGIRPMFYGYDALKRIYFSSEVKSITSLCKEVFPFPPGHIYNGKSFEPYVEITKVSKFHDSTQKEVLSEINRLLTSSVKKRLMSDQPIGYLLSGGLDSSLVCSIASRLTDDPITTFAIGTETDAIDLKYAKIVADYLGTKHHEVVFSHNDITEVLKKVIFHLETWDITTIRASIGMYLICKYITEKTDIRVVLTGEVSDEIFGYKYTDFAPSEKAFQKESEKRINEIHLYDVLRADRCISAHSLEARVPFGDKEFIQYCMAIPPKYKMNTKNMGKRILREAFSEDYLPSEILYRDKAAFSDAVGHSMVDVLKDFADKKYSEKQYQKSIKKYEFATPFTKESLLYRDIFEEYYPGRSKLIKDFWMPNKEWKNCNVKDPSARILPNYGKSGK